MPAQTRFSTDLADWVLGSSASRGTSARRIPRLDYQRRAFGAIERLEARQVLSTAPVDPPAALPLEDLPLAGQELDETSNEVVFKRVVVASGKLSDS